MLIDLSRARHHLERLVAIPSISAQGTLEAAKYVAGVLTESGQTVEFLPASNGRDANVIAYSSDRGGLILSGHLDVVPVTDQSWEKAPFSLTETDGALWGRGVTDMKSFIALTLALAEQPGLPPLIWAFSWGEEIGCLGVRDMLPRLTARNPWGCLIGEPTELKPVIAHRGRASFRVKLHGLPVHSSRADLGRNAIHALAHLVRDMDEAHQLFASFGPFSESFEPPHSSVQVNMINGGSAPNIVAGAAQALIEVRLVPDDDIDSIRASIEKAMARLNVDGTWEMETYTPAFFSSADSLLATLVADAARAAPVSAPFATEAGLYQGAGIPTVVCGPGSIRQAHIADEFITFDALASGGAFLGRLVETRYKWP
ncbi:MAG: M20/M25/M40 family metallo-hydrolase [Rhizobiaceae bacterium]